MSDKKTVIVYGDGVTDDTNALQDIFNGQAIGIKPNGRPWDEDGSTEVIAPNDGEAAR